MGTGVGTHTTQTTRQFGVRPAPSALAADPGDPTLRIGSPNLAGTSARVVVHWETGVPALIGSSPGMRKSSATSHRAPALVAASRGAVPRPRGRVQDAAGLPLRADDQLALAAAKMCAYTLRAEAASLATSADISMSSPPPPLPEARAAGVLSPRGASAAAARAAAASARDIARRNDRWSLHACSSFWGGRAAPR